jgi:hypothetical protein
MDIALALEHLLPAAQYYGSLNLDQITPAVKKLQKTQNGKDVIEVEVEVSPSRQMTPEEIFDAVDWQDKRSKPSWKAIIDAWNDIGDEVLWKPVRALRNKLIATTDWTQLSDSPLTKEEKTEWSAYRQKLRGITETFEHPEDVIWPEQPV